MTNAETTSMVISADLQAQREYVQRTKELGFDFGLTVADAFVRGIRDIGYKSTATALFELVDNSIQAEAKNIHVIFGYGPKSDAKPISIAVVDDGHGMDPPMIRLSEIWGGTHREAPTPNKRKGFGRYGYGLPSASISQGRLFTVYSKVEGGQWHAGTLDLDDISSGKYTDSATGRITVPEPKPANLPSWVDSYVREHFGSDGLAYGTIVLLEKLDRLSWTTENGLETNLLQEFGITYRNYLRQVNLYVNEKRVQPCDPLFTTAGHRFYDLDEDRAEPLEPLTISVKERNTGEAFGVIKVRFSYLPPTFGRKLKDRERSGPNARTAIMRDHLGLIVLREGRQIDVVTKNTPWGPYQNNDRFWQVEVDFPATLDEEFAITTSKQQVVPSERVWELLTKEGMGRVINNLRQRYSREAKALRAKWEEDEEKKRAAEQAMEEAAKFNTTLPDTSPIDRIRRAQERLQQEARKRAEETGRPFEETERDLETETQGQRYKVVLETVPGGPFYRVDQVGAQTVLYVNVAHRFYSDVYAGPESNPHLRGALEVLLFVLGECELDASDDRQLFYQTERSTWTLRLNVALNRLGEIYEDPPAPAMDEDGEADESFSPEEVAAG